ncbi:MAG TPA: type II secretion system protein GspJ [Chthoniobacterales bacterium]|nr:type II secretion system protein GspJ [Chthoniobacterales bacterium]
MVKGRRSRGFTLLEIALAAGILGMMCLAIYRFVQSNITVLRLNASETMEEARYSGLLDLLTTEWQELPPGVGALSGEPFKFNDRPRDEITWFCSTGPGLLTRYAEGEFAVRMRLRPMEKSDKMQLGFLRRPRDAAEGSDDGETWVPVMDDVRGMRIRYFDPRLNAWVDRWTDSSTLPRLVEVILERPNRANWQAIIALGRTPL